MGHIVPSSTGRKLKILLVEKPRREEVYAVYNIK